MKKDFYGLGYTQKAENKRKHYVLNIYNGYIYRYKELKFGLTKRSYDDYILIVELSSGRSCSCGLKPFNPKTYKQAKEYIVKIYDTIKNTIPKHKQDNERYTKLLNKIA